jgi:hypothetical protein
MKSLLRIEGAPKSNAKLRVRMALRDLLIDKREQRRERRIPYLASLTIWPTGERGGSFSAFVRDLSPSGIGLCHLVPMPTDHVVLTLQLPRERTVALKTQIVWCREFADGWFASGGRFVDVLEFESERDIKRDGS